MPFFAYFCVNLHPDLQLNEIMTFKMKKYLSMICAVVATAILFSSCLGNSDDNTIEASGDAMITGFTLDQIQRTIHLTASDGSDSTYISNFSGASCKFSIDHLNGLVFNADSLPKWTNPKKILCTVSTYKSSPVGFMKPDNDTIFIFHNTDTMDFTEPIEFRIYPTDNSGNYRKYMVSVNIHKEEGDSMKWTKVATEPNIAIEKSRLYSLGDSMILMGQKDGATKIYGTLAKDGTVWNEVSANITLDEKAYNNTVIYKNALFTLSNGTLYKSVDAKTWQAISTPAIDNLVAAGSVEMYGIGSGKIMMSKDNGTTWQEDAMSDASADLPVKDFSYVVTNVSSNAETERIVFAGNKNSASDGRNAMIWSKVVEKRADSDTYSWVHLQPSREQGGLPYHDNLCMVQYDGKLFAMNKDYILVSIDDGLVWKIASSLYQKPASFSAQASEITMATDSNKYLWFVTDKGEVWRARINHLAWEENKTAFN